MQTEEDTHMADLPPYLDTDDDTGVGPGRGSTPSAPRWVKVSGFIGGVLVLLVLILIHAGGGPHHNIPSGDASRQTAPSGVTEDHTPSDGGLGGHTPPGGGH
jgi:hypothetical protein